MVLGHHRQRGKRQESGKGSPCSHYISLCWGDRHVPVSAVNDQNSPIKTWLACEKQGDVLKVSSVVFKLLPVPQMRVCEHLSMLSVCFAIWLFLFNSKETYESEMYQL